MTHNAQDCIFLRGLECQCIIGFIDWERRVPQTVIIDLEMPCDCARAGARSTRRHRVNGGSPPAC